MLFRFWFVFIFIVILVIPFYSFGLTLEEKIKFNIYQYVKSNYPFIEDININVFLLNKKYNYCSLENINLENLKVRKTKLIAKVNCDNKEKYVKALIFLDGKIEVFQAKRRILRNERFVIGNNIIKKELKLTDILNNRILKSINNYVIDNIENFSAITVIKKGSIIDKFKLKKNIVIKVGDIIKLVIKHKNIEITTKAIALENAGLGEIIKVRVVPTKKILKGTVKNEETVEIDY